MSSAIVAKSLSKRYLIPTAPDGALEALRDVSFDIDEGEAVGLIGRNGAGKSTLLRILSRVTRPTAGFADVFGTVGALLEVGTGFHPELTGRENAFLSGAILGLAKREVAERFDEIVAFAEIEPFIDVPVKRYSSGMYARLGFAVAAHLRPAILIVDEVLAVGDLAFQAKCLAHMHRLTENGTTVLFVSHNLLAVADLCPRTLFLDSGRLTLDGPSHEAIAAYRRSLAGRSHRVASKLDVAVTVNGVMSPGVVNVEPDSTFRVDLDFHRPAPARTLAAVLNLVVETADGRPAMHLRSDHGGSELSIHPGSNRISIVVEGLPLVSGSYWAWLRLVGLDSEEPLLWDSEKVELVLPGQNATEGILLPPHRFEQAVGQRPSLATTGTGQ